VTATDEPPHAPRDHPPTLPHAERVHAHDEGTSSVPDGSPSEPHNHAGQDHAHEHRTSSVHEAEHVHPHSEHTTSLPVGADVHPHAERSPSLAEGSPSEPHSHAGHDHVHEDRTSSVHGAEHGHPHAHEPHTPWETLRHLLAQPHSHDAADSLDNVLVSSDIGIRAVQLSLIGLAITAALQLAVALTSGSVAVLADTIHNFADASTAIPLWLAFKVSNKPATQRYTYGYGRAEDLAGVFVLLMIVASAAVALWESIQKLINPTPIDHLGWVALAGLAGFAGNELVAQYRIRIGQRIGSAALVADGYHARTDGLASLSVLLGAAGVWLGFLRADPLIGLVITGAILLVLKDATIQMWRRLMDAVEPGLVEQARDAAASAEGVRRVSTVRARWIGHTIHAEALIVADAHLSLGEAHRVAERARHAMLHAVPRLSSVTVHVDPSELDGIDHHAELAHHDHS
jgi:cation diffusion facilitator family transporter